MRSRFVRYNQTDTVHRATAGGGGQGPDWPIVREKPPCVGPSAICNTMGAAWSAPCINWGRRPALHHRCSAPAAPIHRLPRTPASCQPLRHFATGRLSDPLCSAVESLLPARDSSIQRRGQHLWPAAAQPKPRAGGHSPEAVRDGLGQLLWVQPAEPPGRQTGWLAVHPPCSGATGHAAARRPGEPPDAGESVAAGKSPSAPRPSTRSIAAGTGKPTRSSARLIREPLSRSWNGSSSTCFPGR